MIRREDALQAFAEDEYDLVVIGGGITGAGVALDAATRGYSVALVEREDFASGTSSKSSKLVHGGLRYLQNFDLGLVREALLERSILVKLAPHLVRPLPLLVSSFEGKRPDRMLGMGLNMYDRMARELKRPGRRGRDPFMDEEDWSPEKHRIIEGEEVRELLPALAPREPTAAYLFYDCQTDDARLVLTVLGEAERFGAVCANRCRVDELLIDDGRACGVRCTDTAGGAEFEIRATNVVNATGVWADQIRPEELHDEEDIPRIRPSRGTHITFAKADLPLNVGAIVPAGGGRSIFALPWLGRTLIGTTDNDYEGTLDHIPPDEHRHRVPARCRQQVLRDFARARAHHRCLCGRAPAHLDRRSEEVGGHLPQGRAVRDELRHGHDHRREADHLAADGEDGRRPRRRARGPRGAVPDARDPARAERDRGGPGGSGHDRR